MLVYRYSADKTHLPLKIHSICHLSFLKTQRVDIFASHLPLCLIHQIMRMPTNILNFLILVVMIYPLPHMIMMLIQVLIYLRHWSVMIYLLTKTKPLSVQRHFSLRWWLCQVLAVLRLVSLLGKKLLKHSRLLITLYFSPRINQTPRFLFLHLNYMIPWLMHWMNVTQQAHMHTTSGLTFSRFLACHSQVNAYTQHLHVV